MTWEETEARIAQAQRELQEEVEAMKDEPPGYVTTAAAVEASAEEEFVLPLSQSDAGLLEKHDILTEDFHTGRKILLVRRKDETTGCPVCQNLTENMEYFTPAIPAGTRFIITADIRYL